MDLLFYLVLVVGGVGIGIAITYIHITGLFVGCIRVDRSEPDEQPLLFLELKKDVESVSKAKYVILTVKNENFVNLTPHK